MERHTSKVSKDEKNRISLTRVLTKEEQESFSTFRIYRQGGKIILEPVMEIPVKDHWIYKNPEALASLMKGLKDAEEGRVRTISSEELDQWEKELENEPDL